MPEAAPRYPIQPPKRHVPSGDPSFAALGNHEVRLRSLERDNLTWNGCAIDCEIVGNVSYERAFVIFRNVSDSNAYWDTGTCVRATYIWQPIDLITSPVEWITVGNDPDADVPVILLDAAYPFATLWEIHTPNGFFLPQFPAASGLTSVWAQATLFAYDGSANSFIRRRSAQVFEPHFESEAETHLAINCDAVFLASPIQLKPTDPLPPLRVSYFIDVAWFTDVPFADWVPGDEDDIYQAGLPTDTVIHANLLDTVVLLGT